ncbi:unnamed protein product [Clonostachys rhizophaga]|uniref:Uncharacterized protein n=1 Tax=Clonostachys rhizophaga TaxID=160324 RepID=A0A9N9YRL2_9HYPO|nr:unnamed protein product [Clonostachys rhizophaga]
MSFVRGEQPAKSYNDLLDEDKEALDFERAREADGIRNVLTWIMDHISPLYLQTCAPALVKPDERDNLYLFVNNLREACGLTDAKRRRRAQELYFKALKEAENSNKRTDWEKWITNWEQAITIARLRKVPAACGSEWFKDLERHLDSRFEMLLRLEKSQNRSAINEGTYEPAVFSTEFREEILMRRSQSRRKRTRRKRRGSNG